MSNYSLTCLAIFGMLLIATEAAVAASSLLLPITKIVSATTMTSGANETTAAASSAANATGSRNMTGATFLKVFIKKIPLAIRGEKVRMVNSVSVVVGLSVLIVAMVFLAINVSSGMKGPLTNFVSIPVPSVYAGFEDDEGDDWFDELEEDEFQELEAVSEQLGVDYRTEDGLERIAEHLGLGPNVTPEEMGEALSENATPSQ
jgi:hypothetical protein